MKKSNFNPRNEYYNTASRSRYSSRSSRRLQSQYGDSASSSRNRFYNRLEKVCTTFSNTDISKEVFLFRKEIQKLEKEALKKDKVIFELKQSNNHNRQIETELVEVYRVLYMYEGKISQYEKQLKKLQLAISSQVPADITNQVEELLESYRVENSELGAQLEERNRQIMDLEVKMKKLENKYFNTVWKLSSTKREIANPLKKRFPNLRNTITINETPLLEKEKAMKFKSKGRNVSSQNEYQIVREPTPKESQTVLNFKKVQPPPHLETKMSSNSPNPNEYRNSPTSTPVQLYRTSQANTLTNGVSRTSMMDALTSQPKQQNNPQYYPRSVTPQKQQHQTFTQSAAQTVSSYQRYVGGSLPQSVYQGNTQQPVQTFNNPRFQSNYVAEAQKQPYRTTGQPQSGLQLHSQQSNPNLNSQMTVSNSASARRVQFRQVRPQSPRRQPTAGMAVSQQRYAVGVTRDLNEVSNQVKEVQKRISYATGGTSVNGRSVYLG